MPSQLTNSQKRQLKSAAQHLEPVLHLGKSGITPDFLQSAETALTQHELIKVKFVAFKEEKHDLAPQIAEQTQSALVTVIGNVAVLYREHSDPAQRKIVLE
jgi:RNA-binding protein